MITVKIAIPKLDLAQSSHHKNTLSMQSRGSEISEHKNEHMIEFNTNLSQLQKCASPFFLKEKKRKAQQPQH